MTRLDSELVMCATLNNSPMLQNNDLIVVSNSTQMSCYNQADAAASTKIIHNASFSNCLKGTGVLVKYETRWVRCQCSFNFRPLTLIASNIAHDFLYDIVITIMF